MLAFHPIFRGAAACALVGMTGAAGRIQLVAGHFFADTLPEANLLALDFVLHDWGEDKVRRLLRSIHERLRRPADDGEAAERWERTRRGCARLLECCLQLLIGTNHILKPVF